MFWWPNKAEKTVVNVYLKILHNDNYDVSVNVVDQMFI